MTFDLTGLPPTPEEIAAFEGDRSPARRGAGRRPAAGQPALRRALGAALAGRGPLRRDRGLRIRPPHPRRLAIPRLRDRRVQPRQAVRPLPRRADRRRRDRARGPRVPGGVDLPPARPGPPERGQSRDRPEPQRGPDRADRHHRHGVPRPDRRLRPVPQPQARADLARRITTGSRPTSPRPRSTTSASATEAERQRLGGRRRKTIKAEVEEAAGEGEQGDRRREGAAEHGDRGARGLDPAAAGHDPRHLERPGAPDADPRPEARRLGEQGRARRPAAARACWSPTTCPSCPPTWPTRAPGWPAGWPTRRIR